MWARSLHIGINYGGTPAELRGCINDARNLEQALRSRMHKTYLKTDAPGTDPKQVPTKANMLRDLRWICDVSKPGDLLVVTYSGHGTAVLDRDGDEVDGWDEALVPADYTTAGMLTDDDLFGIFGPAADRGVNCVLITDSCYSGTIQRLAGFLAQQSESYGMVRDGYRRIRYLPPAEWMPRAELDLATRFLQTQDSDLIVTRETAQRSALAVTACRDDQVTYDAYIEGQYQGNFTYTLLQALKDLPAGSSYEELMYGSDRIPGYVPVTSTAQRLGRLPSADFDNVPGLYGLGDQRTRQAFSICG